MATLGPETAHIFRITHVNNVPWILKHGLHCKTSNVIDPNFVPIGMPDLIQKRTARLVHRHVPVDALLGIACYDPQSKAMIERHVEQRGLSIGIKSIPKWYF